MTLQSRDQRALALLGVAVAAIIIFRLVTSQPAAVPGAAASAQSPEIAEKRLARLRAMAAQVPDKEQILKQVSAELASREKGLIVADTAAQSQAQLIQIVRNVARAETPPVEIRATEIGTVRPLGDAYGEVLVSVNFDCRIEQLINLMAALSAQPEIVATYELRLGAAKPKEKTLGVRLTVSGVVPRKLVPEKKGASL